MVFYIFATSAGVALLGMLSMLGLQWHRARSGRVELPEEPQPLLPAEKVARGLGLLEKHSRRVYAEHVKPAVRRARDITEKQTKKAAIRTRAQKLIDSVRGRTPVQKRESNSAFLRSIGEYKEQVREQGKEKEETASAAKGQTKRSTGSRRKTSSPAKSTSTKRASYPRRATAARRKASSSQETETADEALTASQKPDTNEAEQQKPE